MKKINIDELIRKEMKEGDKVKLETLRLIKAEFQKVQTSSGRGGRELEDEEQLKVLQKMIKQRIDASQQYAAAGRLELAEQERTEIGIIEEFIPAPPTVETLREYIGSIVTPAMTMKDMGNLVRMVKQEFPTADGKLISDEIRKRLS